MPPRNTHQETHNQKPASVSMSLAPVIPNISIHPISSVNTKSLKDKLKDLIKDARLQHLDQISTRSYSESSSGYRWPGVNWINFISTSAVRWLLQQGGSSRQKVSSLEVFNVGDKQLFSGSLQKFLTSPQTLVKQLDITKTCNDKSFPVSLTAWPGT